MKAQPCPTRAQLTDRNVSAKLNAEAYALPIDVEVKEVGYDCDALVVGERHLFLEIGDQGVSRWER